MFLYLILFMVSEERLNFLYGDNWKKAPGIYARFAQTDFGTCPDCGARLNREEYEDYGCCQRCHDAWNC